eukprot:5508141-Lingulodinium_polyedra.AAC.1
MLPVIAPVAALIEAGAWHELICFGRWSPPWWPGWPGEEWTAQRRHAIEEKPATPTASELVSLRSTLLRWKPRILGAVARDEDLYNEELLLLEG